ncbi:MAG: four helix bundle protein [Phycisphaerae bacterium]|jgi:four helix bundle protein
MNESKLKSDFDLEERTSSFGVKVISFVKNVPQNNITNPLINQIVRSGTSVGANYCEANESVSKKDFIHRISICVKEAKETKHWIRMIVAAEPKIRNLAEELWQECKELHLIFGSIKRNAKAKD